MDQHRDHHLDPTRRDERHLQQELRRDVDGAGELVLHAEDVEVHTERVASGRVVLRKQVVTEEVSVPVTLRHERLEVVEEAFDDRTAPAAAQAGLSADGHASRADALPADVAERAAAAPRTGVRHLDDGDVEITLYAERPVVSVEVVPVERVRVRRGVVTETEKVTVDVAREEAYVEHTDSVDTRHTDRH